MAHLERRAYLSRCVNVQAIILILALLLSGATPVFGAEGIFQPQAVPPLTPEPGILLTNLSQVSDLGNEGLREHNYNVRVRGVAIYISPRTRIYLQEGDAVAYVDITNNVPRAYRGKELEVSGIVQAGWMAPRIVPREIKLIGPADMPKPKRTDVALLNSGADAMHYVTVHGKIRDMIIDGNSLLLLVTENGIEFRALSTLPESDTFPKGWIDAEVEIEGMSRPVSDNFGNAFGFLVYQNTPLQTRILKAGVEDPFSQEPMAMVAAAKVPPTTPHRLKVSGKVLAHVPNKLLYLEDKTGVMRVELIQLLPRVNGDGRYLPHDPQTLLQPGEIVEVIGAPEESRSETPTLVHGEFRRVGKGLPAAPAAISGKDLAAGKLAGKLVTVHGLLLDHRGWSEARKYHEALVLKANGEVIQARWQDETARSWPLRETGWVRVTGVSEVELGRSPDFRSVRLLMRGPEDFVAAEAPPIWAREEISRPLMWAGIIAFVLGVAIIVQRRQMRRLQASEERFRALIERSFDVSLVLNADGSVKYMSPAGQRLFGKSKLADGKNIFIADVVHPDDLSIVREAHEYVASHPGSVKAVSGYRIKVGDEIRYAEALGANCLHVPGVEGIVVHVRDITERKLALDQLQRAVELQTSLNEFATSLSPLHTEEDILWEITRKCISVLGFVDCVIYLLDESTNKLVQRAAYGPKNPRGREILEPIEIGLGDGIVGAVGQTGRAELVADTRLDKRYIVDDAARHSEIAVPITIEGKVIGVIDSEHPNANFFTQEHLAILSSIASICANKIVRARAEQQLKALNSELERRIEMRTAELRASEEKFAKAFHASPIILAIARLSDGTFLDVNEAFLSALDLKREQVIGHSATELGIWRSPSEREGFVTEIRRKGHLHNRQSVVQQNGKPRLLALSAELIDIGGEPCIVSVSADITEREQAEKELLRSLARERELSQLKSRFVATISHEFRTPLGVILSSADILRRYSERLPQATREEHIGDIQQSAMEMARQMENVLAFGRSEAHRLEFTPGPLDLPALARRLLEQISTATEHRCPIRLAVKESFPRIRADEALLTHIITNLLSNAVKYSPPDAPVDFSIEIVGGTVALRVQDHGMGIPQRDREKLFEPFHRGSNVGRVRGTGMGLTIVKRCAELHHGDITIESEEGVGSLVSVQWPYEAVLEKE